MEHKKCCVCAGVATKMCGACQSVYYCGESCQRQHWPVHRLACGRLHLLRLAAEGGGEADSVGVKFSDEMGASTSALDKEMPALFGYAIDLVYNFAKPEVRTQTHGDVMSKYLGVQFWKIRTAPSPRVALWPLSVRDNNITIAYDRRDGEEYRPDMMCVRAAEILVLLALDENPLAIAAQCPEILRDFAAAPPDDDQPKRRSADKPAAKRGAH